MSTRSRPTTTIKSMTTTSSSMASRTSSSGRSDGCAVLPFVSTHPATRPPRRTRHNNSSSSKSMQSQSTHDRRTSTAMSSRTAAIAVAALSLCCATSPAYAQQMNNVTSLSGTWSTGYGAVMTGPGFAAPTNFTFNYPNTTGMSYSFTDDGFFEEAQYRFVPNGTEPHCVQAIIIWQHGNYTINPNNSISLSPIPQDGRIQVQDPCAAETNVITYYDQPTLFSGWSIIADPNHARYMLQLLRFDGALEPRMYLYYKPPMMLPTSQLWTADQYKVYQSTHGVSGALSQTSSSSIATITATLFALLGTYAWLM